MTHRQAVAILTDHSDPMPGAAPAPELVAAAENAVAHLDEESIAYLADAISEGRPRLALVSPAND